MLKPPRRLVLEVIGMAASMPAPMVENFTPMPTWDSGHPYAGSWAEEKSGDTTSARSTRPCNSNLRVIVGNFLHCRTLHLGCGQTEGRMHAVLLGGKQE